MGIAQRSQSRNDATVRVLAVHTTEGTSYTAAGLRDATWWTGSSHAIADDRTLLTPAQGCVPYDRASWTLRSGNPWSENIELVAMAGWTRAQWLTRPGLLDNCARWLAVRSAARRIPLVKLTPAQYRAGQSGVIGHHDHTVGYSDGTHWDPGPNFPWDVVLDKARRYAAGEDEDMATGADVWGEKLEHRGLNQPAEVILVDALTVLQDSAPKLDRLAVAVGALSQQNAGLQAALGALAEAVASGRDDLTAEELRAVIREEMANVVDVQVTVRDGSGSAA